MSEEDPKYCGLRADSSSRAPMIPLTRFLYVVSEGFPPTVFDSQVLDYLRLMEAHGLCFDLVVFERLLGILPNIHKNRLRLHEVQSLLRGRVYFRFLVTTFLGWDMWVPQIQLYSIARQNAHKFRTVVHARTQTATIIALGLKKWIQNVKIVFDMRGDTPAEYLLNAERREKDILSAGIRTKYEQLKQMETLAVKESDAIICVSGAMKEKILGDHKVPSTKVHVIPTSADTRKFYWDPQLREAVRKELGVEGKFVFIYSGSLRAYQSLGALMQFFRGLQEVRPGLHLLLVTPQRTEAEPVLRLNLLHDAYTVRSAGHHEMVRWLNAADAGLLLRESNPVNQVAAPTKFAEYLMCGLPVVLSRGIGDFSNLARREKIGLVLENNNWHLELIERWNELSALSSQNSRVYIAQCGRKIFSNEHFAPGFVSLYLNLL